MADIREEAYILEKIEITEDDIDDDFDYKEIIDEEIGEGVSEKDEESDDDLNNFEQLKAKQDFKMQQKTMITAN